MTLLWCNYHLQPIIGSTTIITTHVFHIFSLAAPDAPENFSATAVNSTSLQATWDEPLDPNGILTGYFFQIELDVGQEYLPSPDPSNYTLSVDTMSLTVPDLHPFANYSLMLDAETSAGRGNITTAFVSIPEAGQTSRAHTYHYKHSMHVLALYITCTIQLYLLYIIMYIRTYA